ncbi:37S ribosomal protein S10 [Colletotrichum sidae]|uniref:Small ribosomal subunit protein uS10m n=1 Tax=Colletotrichum sidae TaxID=1347389 RepID=A0A4R8T2G1_9PEZI|nr:37S ribosomal protein S10 [Colletotrichum sidae]
MEFFADFALRAAYYLSLPAFGPVPLPRITERWTVPRSSFIFKKSQENFERITLRRLIQIRDGNPETVQLWLAFLQKHAYYGIGMKANVWDFGKLGMGESMDVIDTNVSKAMASKWDHLDQHRSLDTVAKVEEFLSRAKFDTETLLKFCTTIGPLPQYLFGKAPSIEVRSWKLEVRHLASILSVDGGSNEARGCIGAVSVQPRKKSSSQASNLQAQDEPVDSCKLVYSIVDLHAITMPQNANTLRQWKRETLAALLAAGIDPERSTLFYQSSSKLSLSSEATVQDDRAKATLKLGLFSYPVLQAADILVHRLLVLTRATHVPVGDDQRQHIEFARECATNFNHVFGPHLVSPETIIAPAKRVMSLRDPTHKMSKSATDPRSRILITDSPEEIHKKVMGARTDSLDHVSYDLAKRPGVSNLLEILSMFDTAGIGPAGLAQNFSGTPLKEFKQAVAAGVVRGLAGIRQRYLDLVSVDKERYLSAVEAYGASKARRSAEETMTVIRETIGL